jgi:hypothetical protein
VPRLGSGGVTYEHGVAGIIDDLSYLDLLHKANELMIQRTVDLQRRCEQIIAETDDTDQRERAVKQLKILTRMESQIPRTL